MKIYLHIPYSAIRFKNVKIKIQPVYYEQSDENAESNYVRIKKRKRSSLFWFFRPQMENSCYKVLFQGLCWLFHYLQTILILSSTFSVAWNSSLHSLVSSCELTTQVIKWWNENYLFCIFAKITCRNIRNIKNFLAKVFAKSSLFFLFFYFFFS